MRSVRLSRRSPAHRLTALLQSTGAHDEARALKQSLGSGEVFGDCRAQAVYHLMSGDVDTGFVERVLFAK